MTHVLLLGGTSGASQLAQALQQARIPAVFSYAGATQAPVAQPVPTRCGGYGGVQGLAQFIRGQGITHVVDATHPFAAQMSRNACAACEATGTPLLALERAPWQAEATDRWVDVPDMAAAAQALPHEPARVFLAIGRKQLDAFAGQARHHYLLRLVDAPAPGSLPLADTTVVLGRGPFSAGHDQAMLQAHGITWLVAKNAGGEATRGKLLAARALGLPVVMVQRPPLPPRPRTEEVDAVLHWIAHGMLPGAPGAAASSP
ncbi:MULTISPECIES: cobalt-precorrin-6A reductase [unclassified Acidovorax]|uniref:cobalt-precorrin-6A reductase n=1 Tax=unclassified Acidovorax TaxID=2684926 RepID=UPI000710FF4C|nr:MULTISPECIES: cobalt-precorrin-6A reductase [unclassified Acidovorax]KRC19572.1 cobalt-precorrin-6X reductase [Acidovorax sp. Root219]KRC23228.1 cobalt-precorrin-6X reductase [Acidovorax sp. Root217]